MTEALVVDPNALSEAADKLQELHNEMAEAFDQVREPTTTMQPPGNDVVSLCATEIFNEHGQEFQNVAARALEVHQSMINKLRQSAEVYDGAEGENRDYFGGLGGNNSFPPDNGAPSGGYSFSLDD